jgi:uncharacterized protein (DUF58 family)
MSAESATVAGVSATPNAERRTPNAPTRIRLRLSRHARMVALMLFLMGVAAVNYQSNAAWGLVMALASALALSALHARRNLAQVTAAVGQPAPVFAGEEPSVSVTLAAGAIDAFDIAVSLPELRGTSARTSVAAGSGAALALVLPPRERGPWRATRLRISTGFPLGLIEAWREIPIVIEGVVYPRPLGDGAAPAAGEDDPSVSGGSQAGTEDFIGHRRYREGEPQRHVDWKAHARGMPLLVKRFAGTGGGVLWCSWGDAAGGTEARLSQLARWVVEAHRGGAAFGLRLPEGSREPDRGPAHYHACLRALALHPRDPEPA